MSNSEDYSTALIEPALLTVLENIRATECQRPLDDFYKFTLTLKGQVIAEQIFDASCYNPAARHNVNIKPFSPRIMSDLQRLLSTPSRILNFTYDAGYDENGMSVSYALNEYNYRHLYIPEPDDLVDAFSFSLMRNDNIIIQRDFSVRNFNKKALFSEEIVQRVKHWAGKVQDLIYQNDLRIMFEENEIVNTTGRSYQEVRLLRGEQRNTVLQEIAGK